MSLKWWEKTVEYQFVLLVAQAKRLFIAPLDDAQERAGDAIFSTENRWVLIEFKKDSASITTEKTKFANYPMASAVLSRLDSHHHIVYGFENREEGCTPHLVLSSQTYFSARRNSLQGILESGAEFGAFKEYVEQFTNFKKPPKGGSGGGLSMNEFAIVAGISPEGNVVECLSLTEFQRQLGLELVQERTLSRGYDGLSR